MVTFISFLLVVAGGLNWFAIGFLQYDYVAGVFGTQASLLSRIVYIFIGLASIWILIMAVRHAGKIDIFNRRFKKSVNNIDVLDDKTSAKQKK